MIFTIKFGQKVQKKCRKFSFTLKKTFKKIILGLNYILIYKIKENQNYSIKLVKIKMKNIKIKANKKIPNQ